MKYLFILPLLLSGCATTIRDRVTEVKVPVSSPCVRGVRPTEIKPLRDQYTKAQWKALGTDQREKLLLSNGMNRKVFGDKLVVATTGCN
jgi:hypothetical protein